MRAYLLLFLRDLGALCAFWVLLFGTYALWRSQQLSVISCLLLLGTAAFVALYLADKLRFIRYAIAFTATLVLCVLLGRR